MKSYIKVLPLLAMTVFFIHCSGDDSTTFEQINGFNAIIDVAQEPTGTNCSLGGIKISSGQDVNENNELDTDEIVSTNYICNSTAGTVLTNSVAEEPGTNCENGGTLIQVGIDLDEDGVLDAAEVQSSFFSCAGTDGETFIVETISATTCEAGGSTFRFGYDNTDDGDLDDNEDEVLEEITICDAVGNPDGFYEFYFAEGLNGYTGTVDCTILHLDPNLNLNSDTLIAYSINTGDIPFRYYSLMRFEGVNQIWDEIESEFAIVEATLYLNVLQALSNDDESWIGVKALQAFEGNFVDSLATSDTYDGTNEWLSDGGFGSNDTHDFSDMFKMSSSSTISYKGIVPLRLDPSIVESWKDPEANDGLSIELADYGFTNGAFICSSEYNPDPENDNPDLNYTPMLYIKVQVLSESARASQRVDEENEREWNNKSYEEKIAPVLHFNNTNTL